MTHLQTIHLAHLPPKAAIHIALYTNVRNAAFLRDQLLAGNTAFEYAFIDATTILSTTHLLAAIYRATTDSLAHRLKSRNIHSEIVLALGCTNNIAATLRGFGISDEKTREMVVVKVVDGADGEVRGEGGDAVARHLEGVIEGENVEFCDAALRKVTDVGLVRKLYKLGAEDAGKKGRRRKDGGSEGQGVVRVDEEEERRELEVAVLGLMALRGWT